ncbi:MAG TPA: hypothetical protein DEG17_15255 [Cyanobacteria bacterium UBA11149]|nr:hypothetical protein [Cyanobacteria bacterium UBA11367]HBE61031.1 hypothetical protein [Cyanobacteria bacterium UBA11366]HBK65749.1 hypothetical protein [Cyanobacteria bacterium UBA11166]HBR72678.1 hypothetical protein [Cyanobacteria bacterium UBA11159]HBS69955.1 hypothetical protein [Cyanobacteria bacterium UBA11153]HBW90191.1 hypothetical protein [Cyanobacteria bacterium UBA11149]HCA95237.1 hypothetical protein [Cyanobacteria bacterium UBA9226]
MNHEITGNSLKACQDLLKSAGAETVKCLVLGKTIRYEEDHDFFYEDGQHGRIKKSIEEEYQKSYSDIESNYYEKGHELLAKYEEEKQELQYDYNEGDLSDEDFDQFDCELKQIYIGYEMELEDQFNHDKDGIGYETC